MKTYDDNLKYPRFRQLLEEARIMVQRGKNTDAAYHVLQEMNLSKDENNVSLFDHIPNRPLAKMLGIPNPEGGGKTAVFNARDRLRQERCGKEKDIIRDDRKVDTSQVEIIGSGDESVYLYYFPTYQWYAESLGSPHWLCNIGRTENEVTARVSQQIGDQCPEIPQIALILRTEDCRTLEKRIHDALKRERRQIANAIGTEWFKTSPSEVLVIYQRLSGID
ncbi:hypothetical protein C6499_04230 [Candidatus Poribacteria bacterium]|nr:MAG: hypothetical protein C6499_04230 [Candidatus Poribacteria bacterium]